MKQKSSLFDDDNNDSEGDGEPSFLPSFRSSTTFRPECTLFASSVAVLAMISTCTFFQAVTL